MHLRKLKVEKFYKSNPAFDKAKTKELLTKLQQAIILDKVKTSPVSMEDIIPKPAQEQL